MLGVVMAMGMHVPCAVSMYVFVFVEDDFEVPAERVGDMAERFQAGDLATSLHCCCSFNLVCFNLVN